MVFTANDDVELTDWLNWTFESGEVPSFYRTIAEAAFCADVSNYNLIRPVLLKLKQQQPILTTLEHQHAASQELPFTSYPGGGREQLTQRPGRNTRHSDGPEFMKITGVKTCAYCGLDFTAKFEDWLTMVLDHVVPQSVCKSMGIDSHWVWSYSNAVLACEACNGFCNRYKPTETCSEPISLSEFYDLRDRIFLERRPLILARREKEKRFFETEPWESKHVV